MVETPYVLTDVRIPFWRLVAIFFKAGAAAVPAIILLLLLLALVTGIFWYSYLWFELRDIALPGAHL
jgi:hypothetical protein